MLSIRFAQKVKLLWKQRVPVESEICAKKKKMVTWKAESHSPLEIIFLFGGKYSAQTRLRVCLDGGKRVWKELSTV